MLGLVELLQVISALQKLLLYTTPHAAILVYYRVSINTLHPNPFYLGEHKERKERFLVIQKKTTVTPNLLFIKKGL